MYPSEHEKYNAEHYPGTRQLCDKCGEPTGRCEDDTIWDEADNILCPACLHEKEDREEQIDNAKS